VRRAGIYLAAGADCVYPIIAPADSIARLVVEIDGPVNAMSRPGGPTIAELAAAGVARITFGSGLYSQVMAIARGLADELAAEIGAWSRPAQR
jgi:2-methylisocitrate lyase-like PEP mutase family enzyme